MRKRRRISILRELSLISCFRHWAFLSVVQNLEADVVPRCHMFYSKRLLDIPDGLPKWSEMQNKSELIEDSPPEVINKRKREIEEEEKNGEKDSKSSKKDS